jgi:sirohydrochlorin ferrochelatase
MATKSVTSTAVLLIAHGSRRQEANDDLLRLADAVRKRVHYQMVEVAYLEIADPTIPEGARRCIEQGACRVLMLPYFLSAGAHVVNDLKRHQRELASAFPEVSIELCRPLQLHPLLIEVVLLRLDEMKSE